MSGKKKVKYLHYMWVLICHIKKLKSQQLTGSSSANLTWYMSQLMRNHLLPNTWNHHNNCVTIPSEKLRFREKCKCLFWVAINAGILGGRWRQSRCGTLRGGRLPLTSAVLLWDKQMQKNRGENKHARDSRSVKFYIETNGKSQPGGGAKKVQQSLTNVKRRSFLFTKGYLLDTSPGLVTTPPAWVVASAFQDSLWIRPILKFLRDWRKDLNIMWWKTFKG